MKKITIIFFLFSLNCLTAQVAQEWVATYSGTGSGYNFPKKSAIDKKGNFIVTANSDSTDDYDYIVLKYNPSGNLIWKQRYNGIGNSYDYLIGMVLDDSDNVYVTGGSDEGVSNGSVNWVTIKYNSEGVMQWKRSLNWIANGVDEPFGMTIDKNNNIYVIGFGRITFLERAMITIKYNSNGDSIWTKNYTSLPNRTNWGYSVATDDSLNVYSSGYGAISTGNEIVTIKYDLNGNEKWIQKYPTYEGDYLRPTFSEVDKENNLVIVGYSYISNNYDFVTLKYSSHGVLIWSRLFAGANDDYANSIFLDDSNNILIGGSSYSIGFSDYLILKYSANGDTLLFKLIEGGGLNTDEVNSIISDKIDNIYVTGFSQSASGVEHYLTVKLNSSGDTLWSKIYRNAYSNSAYCLNLSFNGSVYVSGAGGLPGGNSGIVTIKYSQLTGMILEEENKIESYELSNYPNPFNPSTKIYYSIPVEGNIKITIYNSIGQKITEVVNDFKTVGNYTTEFNGSYLASGIYYYKIEAGSFVQTKKMLLLK